jgi:serine/threonine protein kinase
MSTVLEAEVVGSSHRVALKILHPSLADDPEATARLKQEAEMVRSIGHPNICAVFDMGRTSEGEPYLVMERLFGQSLAERIRLGVMTFSELAPIIIEILTALGAAHARGVLHRDLKPENIFIEQRAPGEPIRARLLDFGVAKSIGYELDHPHRLTDTGMVMGTPYYMAPEQARGESRLDERVDLWAIGVIFYEALSGRRPFVANNYNALLVKILTSHPRPLSSVTPGVPPLVVALVDKAMAKLREDRFQSADELITAIITSLRACAPHPSLAAETRAPTIGELADTHKEAHYRRRTESDVSLRAAGNRLPAYTDYDDEPYEATIQERARDASQPDHAVPYEAAAAEAPALQWVGDAARASEHEAESDTEIILRPDWESEVEASIADSETEVFDRLSADDASGAKPAKGHENHVEANDFRRKR